jgi:methionine-rich copper-binding protein CopC
MSKTVHIAGCTMVLCGALAGEALAHAELVSTTPPADSTVKAAPTELDLKFSEGLSLKFSGVQLTGPDKEAVKTGTAALGPNDDTTLVLPLPASLAAGMYTVEWHVLSSDGHKTHGSYAFIVKP